MRKLYLVGGQNVELEENDELFLEYFMVEELKDCGPVFGIEITGRRGAELTREYTGAISDDVGFVRRLAEKLYLGVVTPISLVEQVDQLLEVFA